MEDTYTEEAVIKALMVERIRARDIAHDFQKKYEEKAIEYKVVDSIKLINEELADSARLIGNAILGIDQFTALSGHTLEDEIKKKLK